MERSEDATDATAATELFSAGFEKVHLRRHVLFNNQLC